MDEYLAPTTAATYAFTVPAPGAMFVVPTPTLNMTTAQQFLDVCVTKDPVACLTGEMAVPMVRPQLRAAAQWMKGQTHGYVRVFERERAPERDERIE